MKCLNCGSELTSKDSKKFCNRSCSAQYNNRQRTLMGWKPSEQQRQQASEALKGRPGHSKNKGKLRVPRIEKICPQCGKTFSITAKCVRVYCSTKCSLLNRGGARKGSGQAKTGYYRGIYCGSTYELVWVVYRLDHNLPVNRFDGFVVYGNNQRYYPDFVEGNVIHEMKGWRTEKLDPTLAQKEMGANEAGYSVKLYFKEDLVTEFKWVTDHYKVKKFEELYDDYKPKYSYVCDHCGREYSRGFRIKTEVKFCSRQCAGAGHKGRATREPFA